jgi:hypothetical protein
MSPAPVLRVGALGVVGAAISSVGTWPGWRGCASAAPSRRGWQGDVADAEGVEKGAHAAAGYCMAKSARGRAARRAQRARQGPPPWHSRAHARLPPRLPRRQPCRRAQAHRAGRVLRHMNLKDKGWRWWTPTPAPAAIRWRATTPTSAPSSSTASRGCGPRRPAAAVADWWPGARLQRRQGRCAVPRLAGAGAQMLMRPQDQLRLFELHPTDHKILAVLPGRRARRGGEDGRRLCGAEVAAAAAHAARRGADRPQLRDQDRLRARAGGAARGAGALCRRRGDRLAAAAAAAGSRAAAAAPEGQPPAARALAPRRAGCTRG